jgi:hypothetical protein
MNKKKAPKKQPATTVAEERKRAQTMLMDFMRSYPEIPGSIWVECCISIWISASFTSKMPIAQFNIELENMRQHYERAWSLYEEEMSGVQGDKDNIL